jgi:GDP-4-dehydro-6-deoxy-D-mannose reductase
LVKELLRRGDAVVGGTLEGIAPEPTVLDLEERGRIRWVPLDVNSVEQLETTVADARPRLLFHLAAQSSVGLSFDDVLGTWETNATGTLRLLQVVSEVSPSTRVLVVSSSEVYGAVPEAEQPISESRPLHPLNPYAASKAAAELASVPFTASGSVAVVIARSFNHTGPGQSTRFALPNWAEQLGRIGRGELEGVLRVGNLEARRDLLDVRDVVRAYCLLAEVGVPGTVYNVCRGEARSLREVVEELVALSGTGARIETDTARLRPVDIPLLLGDSARLRALGWAPRITLRQTLLDLLAYTQQAEVSANT